MKHQEAYALFEQMIQLAKQELLSFTLTHPFTKEAKPDKSLVTACDKTIDLKLSQLAKDYGLQVISEEGEHAQQIVESGNYITIDPIDGTLGYIDYVTHALETGDIHNFLKRDLGAEHDFSLLLGIVEDGVAQYAALFCYVTGEKIFLDGNSKKNCIREHNIRNYSGTDAVYTDQRPGGDIEESLKKLPFATVISQATLGLKSVYTLINPHASAITVHLVQNAGLWDVLPAVVAARAFGGEVLDSHANPLELTKYIVLPPTGAIIIKGEKFRFVLKEVV